MKNCIYHRLDTQALNSPPKRGNSRVSVSDIFDKIIHGAYIRKSEGDLHVESDRGDQYIIDSEEFKSILDALCLSDNESVFIMCQILRDKVQKFQTACEEDIMSDNSRKLSGQIHNGYLMWLIGTYCSTEDLSQEVRSRLFPEHIDKQFVSPYWHSSSSYGRGQSYFDVEIGSRWDKDGVELIDNKKISLYDLLSLIENHTGQC